ncbi:MAG TPA: TadE family protein [Nocardioidaceae bacterium]|nr:TadE family protein [Nocardioidaceae bacterium]
MRRRRRDESAAAVVDFVLIMILLVPLVLGIIQVGLVMHVRNTLTAAASDGARYGAGLDHSPDEGAQRTRELIDGALAGSYADDVTATETDIEGAPGVEIRVHAEVPALGLFGPAVELDVEGHAVWEVVP